MKTVLVVAVTALVAAVGGVAWAATLTLSSKHLGGAAVTSPVMYPDSVTIANKSGGTAGKPENGDIVTLVWSQPIDETTLCSGWSNSSSTQSVSLQWSIIAGTSPTDDKLQPTGASPTCSGGFNVGSIDLGSAGYDTSATNIDFQTTTNALTVGATTTTLKVTLGGIKNGTAGTVPSGNAAVWTPSAILKDRSGNTCGSNLAKSSATKQF